MPVRSASMFRLDRADEARLLAEAARQIERVGLADQIDQPAGSLSLGQQRIVEIARALCADPMLLLLDEPAAGLRHLEKQRLAALLRQLRDGGMSVLLVEHDMGFVMDLADRVVVLDFGTKIAEGTPEAIKSNPEVIKAYLGAVDMSALLSVSDVHIAYGKVEAVRGVSLDVRDNEIVTIVGANGAGKTTLLNAVMGVLPLKGRVAFARGRPRAARDRGPRRAGPEPGRRAPRAVLQHERRGQSPARRVPRGEGASGADAFERVYALFPRLKERRKQLAGTLSGGEQQMLAMGRALMGAPKLLMLDEPSLGLAPIIVADIFRTIGELRAGGVSVLLVEQNAQAALKIADRAYVMELGEFVLNGLAGEIAANTRVAASYLGFTHEGESAI